MKLSCLRNLFVINLNEVDETTASAREESGVACREEDYLNQDLVKIIHLKFITPFSLSTIPLEVVRF